MSPQDGAEVIAAVSPSCDPAQRAMTALDRALGWPTSTRCTTRSGGSASWPARSLRGHELDAIAAWNAAAENVKIGVVLDAAAWPEGIGFDATPMFFVIRGGVLVDRIWGWPSDERLEDLGRAIEAASEG